MKKVLFRTKYIKLSAKTYDMTRSKSKEILNTYIKKLVFQSEDMTIINIWAQLLQCLKRELTLKKSRQCTTPAMSFN